MLTLEDIKQARVRTAPYILKTPLVRVAALDELMKCQVYCKLECTQITGSFKFRGAMNGMLCLSPEEREKGVVCYSSGNHAQGVAYAAKLLGVDAKVVMPTNCNPVKLENVKKHGASAVLVDAMLRDQVAAQITKDEGRTMLHAFANTHVKAGQGIAGLEIVEDLPDPDAVVVPIGGGGLISGIGTAVKALAPSAKVFGIENVESARYTNCIKNNKVLDLKKVGETIRDGTRGNHADQESYTVILSVVDEILLAEDKWVKPALKALIGKGHVVAEPSSCMGLAVALAGKLPVKPSDKVVFVLSGGNCDLKLLADILSSDEY